jgi:hypothetical protein
MCFTFWIQLELGGKKIQEILNKEDNKQTWKKKKKKKKKK